MPLVRTLTSPAAVALVDLPVGALRVAEHAVADQVPRAVDTVVAHVGVPRGHGRGSNHLLVERQELCRLQQVHNRDVVLPSVAANGPGHVVDGDLF
jgi:hypothetical protein